MKMLIQLTTNLGMKIVSACSKTVVKGSAHLFPNSDENLNLVYKSVVGGFKFGSVWHIGRWKLSNTALPFSLVHTTLY